MDHLTDGTRDATAGLQVAPLAGDIQVINVRFRSQGERLGLSIGQSVERVLLPNPDRLAPEWLFLPELALIGLVAELHWRGGIGISRDGRGRNRHRRSGLGRVSGATCVVPFRMA